MPLDFKSLSKIFLFAYNMTEIEIFMFNLKSNSISVFGRKCVVKAEFSFPMLTFY